MSLRAGEVAALGAAALALNLTILTVGTALGVDFVVVSFVSNREETVGVQGVIVMTSVAWLLGSLLLAVAVREDIDARMLFAVMGALLAVVTIPFFNDADTSTRLTLASMHLATAGFWIFTALRQEETRLR